MMKIAEITCCRECRPPKRHEACWDTCPEYQEQKKKRDDYKELAREARKDQYAGFSEYALNHTYSRGKRRKKGQL